MINWEAIGAIAEGMGAFAVVVTLIYLSLQVRYAKSTAADSNRLVRASGVREIVLSNVLDDEARRSIIRALDASQFYEDAAKKLNIDILDAERADFTAQYYFWLHWGQYSTTMTGSDRKELENVISRFYTLPAIRNSWDQGPFGKVMFDAEFISFVDRILVDSSNDT